VRGVVFGHIIAAADDTAFALPFTTMIDEARRRLKVGTITLPSTFQCLADLSRRLSKGVRFPGSGPWDNEVSARVFASEAVSRKVLEQPHGPPGVNILREHLVSIQMIDGGMIILISMIMEYGSDLFSQPVSVLRERAQSGAFGPRSESLSIIGHLFGHARLRTVSPAPPRYSKTASSLPDPTPLEARDLWRVSRIRQLIASIPGNSSTELEEAMESWRRKGRFRRGSSVSDLPVRPTTGPVSFHRPKLWHGLGSKFDGGADLDEDVGATNVRSPRYNYNPDGDIQAVIFDSSSEVPGIDRVPIERLLNGRYLGRDSPGAAASFRLICLPANNMDVSRLVEFLSLV